MILIFFSIVVSSIIFSVILRYGTNGDNFINLIAILTGLGGLLSTAIVALFYATLVWQWLSADYQAQIINREYGTNYTQEEIFYAKDVIETIRQIDRNRYEVNGNLQLPKQDILK